MGFNRSRTIFTCEPKCPERKPGCHDHCKKYQGERSKNEERKAAINRDHLVDNYMKESKAKKMDAKAKSKRSFAGYSWAKRY